ncbi:phenazine biosynthesis protein [Streptomyces sp. TR1341]|uniref:phenazine biosynthesis protein n=1 Tax=Streptomyces sp. TR1341 TaxID=2601266 RepID=UPI00138AD725|nr:phenazine biosynthesis protein [Streptomyces sp. TR1341]
MEPTFPDVPPGAEVPDDFIRDVMRWHFDPSTGSPFWLKRAGSLGFDPLTDITSWADLARFPDVGEEWRDVPAADLVPAGSLAADGRHGFRVFDSGGTTGRPKRIIDGTSRVAGVTWTSSVLAQHGLPGTGAGDWLHLGPTGPHIVGRSVGLLAELRQSLCHYIDFDPRWVKRSLAAGRTEEAKRYLDHVLDQASDVLSSQPVTVVFATPPVLEAVASRPRLLELFQERVRGIIWAGTSVGAETLRLLDEEVFPDARLVGLYGNTMMGIAPQRPPRSGDTESCVFVPHHPGTRAEVVDPEHPDRLVGYGERGQVRITVLSKDLLVPRSLERDRAVRIAPNEEYPWDAVAGVGPLATGGAAPIEGVY